MESNALYHNLKERTNGQLLIGVVGPVRTGKSTFIRHFMEITALRYMEERDQKEMLDQLPVSGSGKLITTVEPKFIPREAVEIKITDELKLKLRMIDCVGFIVKGAQGNMDNDNERLVKTPWSEKAMPFSKAADFGTYKVINDHAAVAIMITTDASFGDISRENFLEAEEKTVNELKKAQKPFVIVLNTKRPYSEETRQLVETMRTKWDIPILPINCEQLKAEDITKILEAMLSEFPVIKIAYYIPRWAEILDNTHPVKQQLFTCAKMIADNLTHMRDVKACPMQVNEDCIRYVAYENVDPATGEILVRFDLKDIYYYRILTELTGMPITDEYDLINLLKALTQEKEEYDRVRTALDTVRQSGYGVVLPFRNEINIQTPEIIHQGNRYGVRLKAASPTIHLIRTDIETEVAPILGSEQQAKDLVNFIEEKTKQDENIMDIKIFGKSIAQLMEEGIQTKIMNITSESQEKLQNSMKKIVNDSNGGIICIII